MGKKKIAKAEEEDIKKPEEGAESSSVQKSKSKKKRVESGVLYVESTYNNTKLTLTDEKNNPIATSSSGALGFKGAKKGTPFAAAKIGEALAEKAQAFGVKEIRAVIRGVGSGRESAIRGFISKGINLISIQDKTAVPHNGPKPPKPRRN